MAKKITKKKKSGKKKEVKFTIIKLLKEPPKRKDFGPILQARRRRTAMKVVESRGSSPAMKRRAKMFLE